MKIFLDTEFTDLLNCELISIGMVSEDGRHEFYGERTDFDAALCNSFVRAAVLPQLGQFPDAGADREKLRARLAAWFATLPRSVQIGCDSFTDWELLLDSFDGDAPANIQGRYDLRPLIDTTVFHQAVCRYHEAPGQSWHHALHDARAHRAGWLAWSDKNKD